MKILHVIPTFAPAWQHGGPIQEVLGLTRELVRQGQAVTVMTTNVNGSGILDVPVECPVFMDGVEVWYFPVEHPRWWYFSRSLGRALRQQVKRFDLVNIHSIFLWPTTIAAFWCRRYQVPYIIRPAGALDPICLTKSYDRWWVSLNSRVKKQIYLNTLGRMDLEHASAIHFASQAEMEAARPLNLRAPTFIVPSGVDSSVLEVKSALPQRRERYPQLKGKKMVLFLSRLDPKKGLDLLISALGELAGRRKDFAFVLAGSGTKSYEAKVAALVKEQGLGEHTVFVGLVEGKAKWQILREADVFVLPSYRENFGVAVVEAMAAGIPVVISNRVNIHKEIVQAGAGVVTDLNPKEIGVAVEQLLGDGELRREMGKRGSKLVRERFTWEKVTKEMVCKYENILGTLRSASACQR